MLLPVLTKPGRMKIKVEDIFDELAAVVSPEAVHEKEPLKKHTTFRVGGPCDYLVEPRTKEEAARVAAICRAHGVPCFVIGNGSNLLVSDEGYRGVIIKLLTNFSRVEVLGDKIRAQAGATLKKAALAAYEAGLGGLAFASGIPGTIGGAVSMNAGAYGGEMRQVAEAVTVMRPDGSFAVLAADQMQFGYRTSIIKQEGLVVVEALLRLVPDEKSVIKADMDEYCRRRREKQPLNFASAGSTFKRPEGYFAGKLIMDAGLRGSCVGDACVSTKHCGFIINRGNATAADIHRLIRKVQAEVFAAFGVTLETEVRMLGAFPEE